MLSDVVYPTPSEAGLFVVPWAKRDKYEQQVNRKPEKQLLRANYSSLDNEGLLEDALLEDSLLEENRLASGAEARDIPTQEERRDERPERPKGPAGREPSEDYTTS